MGDKGTMLWFGYKMTVTVLAVLFGEVVGPLRGGNLAGGSRHLGLVAGFLLLGLLIFDQAAT